MRLIINPQFIWIYFPVYCVCITEMIWWYYSNSASTEVHRRISILYHFMILATLTLDLLILAAMVLVWQAPSLVQHMQVSIFLSESDLKYMGSIIFCLGYSAACNIAHQDKTGSSSCLPLHQSAYGSKSRKEPFSKPKPTHHTWESTAYHSAMWYSTD